MYYPQDYVLLLFNLWKLWECRFHTFNNLGFICLSTKIKCLVLCHLHHHVLHQFMIYSLVLLYQQWIFLVLGWVCLNFFQDKLIKLLQILAIFSLGTDSSHFLFCLSIPCHYLCQQPRPPASPHFSAS